MASIKIKFKIFPTPKYLRIKNMNIPEEKRIPLLELAKIKERVKKIEIKKEAKNNGTAPVKEGSKR
ncbi:hypothetical protein A2Z67_03450 [Candidatus Woesebacteria bacterium RBG_13_36_22]|uniref:Uncharacterized protein n=1 Tax=Candidatus Woesebacteria bacterium RBG_13_36_22 TaxID=1802478 RepID=A0A1F7X627_9BACT|nr:MAG: hypothetical protein A2Z67_03450 [Candidatus Woesebacteria bacterium RBG_13_36_22]